MKNGEGQIVILLSNKIKGDAKFKHHSHQSFVDMRKAWT